MASSLERKGLDKREAVYSKGREKWSKKSIALTTPEMGGWIETHCRTLSAKRPACHLVLSGHRRHRRRESAAQHSVFKRLGVGKKLVREGQQRLEKRVMNERWSTARERFLTGGPEGLGRFPDPGGETSRGKSRESMRLQGASEAAGRKSRASKKAGISRRNRQKVVTWRVRRHGILG